MIRLLRRSDISSFFAPRVLERTGFYKSFHEIPSLSHRRDIPPSAIPIFVEVTIGPAASLLQPFEEIYLPLDDMASDATLPAKLARQPW
jgi:hypothetical protein